MPGGSPDVNRIQARARYAAAMTARFHEESAALDSSGRRLAWTRPTGAGRHAAVLLLPPLGARTAVTPLCDGETDDGLRALARACADAELITLRVDAEGSGAAAADVDAEIADARAALDLLAHSDGVDADAVFVFGWSLGATLAPLAARERAVRGIVVYGATSRRWTECLRDGARRQLALAGWTGPALEREVAAAARLYERLFRGHGTAGELFDRDPALAASVAARDVHGECIHGRPIEYFRALDRIDPAACWRAVDVPVLALWGEYDWIVSDDDHQRIAAWVREGGRDAKSVTVGGVDHDSLRRTSFAEGFTRRGQGQIDGAVARASIEWMRGLYCRPEVP
jgi:dienelactone hydrolase